MAFARRGSSVRRGLARYWKASMALRDRFSKKLTCPQCGNSGFAEASEIDDPKRKHPGFSVDHLPRGFFIQRASNHQETSMIKCECGRKFPFRSLAEAAAERL
ncbi:hypothetical protein EV291_102363 [Rhizobium sp. BK068]|nr:hypothetical protein EV291_102363 [Rhizobium sp. BK068]